MKANASNPFVVVLHLSAQENISYGHPWYALVKSVRPDCDYLDLDQQSEKSLLEHIRKAIEQAHPFILLIDVASGAETPAGMSLLADTLLRHASNSYAILKGQHEIIQKWLTPLKDHLILYSGEEELRGVLKSILNQDFQDSF